MTAPTRSPAVVVVGDVGIDILVRADGPVVFGQDTRARIGSVPGGAGGNTAGWLAGLGVEVTLLARVGDDDDGRSAAADLAAAGVRCRFAVDPVLPTCRVVVIITPDGERTMLPDRGANAALRPEDVALPAGRPGHLHLSGYVLLDSASRGAGLAALTAARAAGWTISVDPQTATHLAEIGAATFLEWVRGVDLLLPNDSELAALGGTDSVLRAVGAVAVTHGPAGASWLDSSGGAGVPVAHVPAPAVLGCDTTGSGDAFDAGLLAAWLTGAGPEASLRAGVLAGTAAAGGPGARPQPGSPWAANLRARS